MVDFPTLYVAHRGARNLAPENTASAFRLAMVQGIDGIEFDVQLTLDHIVVLHHDRTLQRVAGIRRPVSQITYDELSRLDVGSYFSNHFKHERILKLEDLLINFRGKFHLFIEIKSGPKDRQQGTILVLAEKVLQLIRNHIPEDLLSTVHILSFDKDVLTAAYRIAPKLKYILNHSDSPLAQGDLTNYNCNLWGHGIRIAKLSRGMAKKVHDHNQRILTWTCNGPRQLAKAIRLHADIILTDNVSWIPKLQGIKP